MNQQQHQDNPAYFTDNFYRFLFGFSLILTTSLLILGAITYLQDNDTQVASPPPTATTTTQ